MATAIIQRRLKVCMRWSPNFVIPCIAFMLSSTIYITQGGPKRMETFILYATEKTIQGISIILC